MTPRARAACIVLDATDVATVDLRLSAELKERARIKGYQDAAAALFLMADGKPPHRGAQRFARAESLPPYVRALLGAAYKADAAYALAQLQLQLQAQTQTQNTSSQSPAAGFADLFFPHTEEEQKERQEEGQRNQGGGAAWACAAPFAGLPCGVCRACTESQQTTGSA